MLEQAVLGRLVVIRRHEQAGVYTRFLGAARQTDRFAGRIGPGAANYGYATAHTRDDLADKRAVLVLVKRRRLTRGADRDDSVGVVFDVELDEPTGRIEIDVPARHHRRDHRNNAASKHATPPFLGR